MSDYVEPLGRRILIRKDEGRQTTRGGIVLPDKAEIPTITGRVVEISTEMERDSDFPVKKYDKVLFHPKNAIPVDLESDNVLYVVPVEDIVAVFRKSNPPISRARKSSVDKKANSDKQADTSSGRSKETGDASGGANTSETEAAGADDSAPDGLSADEMDDLFNS